MDERGFRVLIKHYLIKAQSLQEIKQKLDIVVNLIHRLERFINDFKSGHMSIRVVGHFGRPLEATTLENINRIFDWVMGHKTRLSDPFQN